MIVRFLGAGVATLALTLLLGAAADADVSITINGNNVDVEPAPILQAGRVFVPLRGVFENLGATVVYDNGQINATGNGREISLHIGSTQATVGGNPQTIDTAPFIVGASTYVPLRFISQALGASVNWDDADQVVEISMAGGSANYPAAPEQSYQDYNDGDFVDAPPPPIPYYNPPPVPEANDIWVPGYWAWGSAGYYWIPGIWTQPPQPGYLWTPGYWGSSGNSYSFHAGYWGVHIGFYGGINYGAGYFGHGYVGGRWEGNTFAYNTAVTPVANRTVIRNVYVDKTAIVNSTTTVNRISYNGGRGGLTVRPTQTELQAASGPHRAPTAVQQQHIRVAAQDRQNFATVNAGKPPIVVAPHPFTPAAKPANFTPVTQHDRAPAQHYTVRSAPAAAKPADVKPADVKPAAAAPDAMRPDATRPDATRPDVAHPDMTHPDAAQPEAVHPAGAAPDAAHPEAMHPDVTHPVIARPQAAAPPMTAPVRPPVVHHAPPIPAVSHVTRPPAMAPRPMTAPRPAAAHPAAPRADDRAPRADHTDPH